MDEIRNIISRIMGPLYRRCIDEAVRAGNYGTALSANNLLYDLHHKRYRAAVMADDVMVIEAELDELDKIAHQSANIEKLFRRE